MWQDLKIYGFGRAVEVLRHRPGADGEPAPQDRGLGALADEYGC